MFLWTFRLCLFAFMAWTMSIPGTECYIAPPIWAGIVLLYFYSIRGSRDVIFNIFYE